jgi:hypothetical protein
MDDPLLPLVFRRDDALAAGLSRHQIAQRLRSGRWLRLSQAVYVVADVVAALPAREQHLVHVFAALLRRGDGHVASHLSAAAVHDWALPLGGAGRPALTRHTASGPTRRRDAVVHVAGLDPRSTMTRRVPVGRHALEIGTTRPARTVADCLRHLPLAHGVALGDSALRTGQVTWPEVAAQLDRQRTWPYAARGRAGLALLDPRRETWLESFSFVTLVVAGAPCPEPQVRVHDAAGLFVARVDGWLEAEAVALEADGSLKYLLDVPTLPADPDAAAEMVAHAVRRRLMAQNERERRLLELGVQVVRWGTYDITRRPETVLAAVAAARRRGDRTRFTGSTTSQPAPSWLTPAPRAFHRAGAPLRPPNTA